MTFLQMAKRLAAYKQAVTGIMALALFALFAGSVVWLHRTAQVDSPTLGISVWADEAATEGRVKRVVDVTLKQASLATRLAEDIEVVSRIGAKDGAYVNAWKGLDATAEALASDGPRQLLSDLWIAQISRHRSEILALARTTVTSTAPEGVNKIAELHQRALGLAIDTWLSLELPPSRIESLLADGNAEAIAPGVRAKRPPSPPPLDTLVASIHARTKSFLSDRIQGELSTVLSRDLDPLLAQSAIAGAVHKDFAARWMWIISAALFLTFAVSAIAGAVPRLLALVERKQQPMLLAALVAAAIGAAFAGQRFIADIGPPFLTRPVRELATTFDIGLASTVTFLNVVAAVAVAALLVTAWASFLIPTRDEKHLDVQLGTLRWVLHTATFVLVAGVFETYALTHWPTVLLAEPAANMVESGAQIASLAIGAALSTLLLLIYVPGAVALTEEARRRQREGDDTTRATIEAMVTRHGFDTSATKQIATFAQLLLPLIVTAPLSQFAQLLGS